MRICVVFNPAAKGQKAGRFLQILDTIASECELKRTSAPGDARRLATEAVGEGFETIIAAGGDGTLNEVLNGIGDAPDGFKRVRLGVLPLGTINVFARELGIPLQPEAAWAALRDAGERRIDLPCVESGGLGETRRIYFVQLAGAGLDARAIELVDWQTKKKVGPFAYVIAGLKAMAGAQTSIVVADGVKVVTGQLVLIGNGKLYGGSFRIFPKAALTDGYLHVCVFPAVNWSTLIRCGVSLLLRRRLPESAVVRLRTRSFSLTGKADAVFEVDGELGGHLPVRISVLPEALRVLAP